MFTQYLIFYILIFIRCYALISVFSSSHTFLKQQGIVTLSLVLSISMCASELGSGVFNPVKCENVILFVVSALRECFIGALIGLPLAIAVQSLVMSARIVDTTRGAQFSEQVAPENGYKTSSLEGAAALFVLVIAFTYGGYQILVMSLYESFKIIQIGLSFDFLSNLNLISILSLSQKAISIGLLIAAPVVAIMFLIDFSAALISRSLGRVNIVFELMPLKMALGVILFTVLCLGIPVRVIPDAISLINTFISLKM
jgi:type III secretory pathway component EscT